MAINIQLITFCVSHPMSIYFHGIRRWLIRPKFLFLTITFGVAASWYLIMSYTPNIAPDLEPLTFAYKTVEGAPIYLDIYSPSVTHHGNGVPNANVANPSSNGGHATVPAVLYFHGGGLTVGNRTSWFPKWLHS
jgi:acetyl esterase/lipase